MPESVKIYLEWFEELQDEKDICDENGAWVGVISMYMGFFIRYDEYNYNSAIEEKTIFNLLSKSHEFTDEYYSHKMSTNSKKRIKFIAELNIQELKKIIKESKEFRKDFSENPNSLLHKRRAAFYDTVEGELKLWFKEKGIDITHLYSDPSHKVNRQDQDDLIDKFRLECERKGLQKGKSIRNNDLYEIGIKLIPDKMPKEKILFKSGNKAYHILREYASRTKYKKGRSKSSN